MRAWSVKKICRWHIFSEQVAQTGTVSECSRSASGKDLHSKALSPTGHQKKRLVSTSRFFIDINLLRDFLYVLTDLICANALDMLPDGNEIYIISSFE